jgi:anti-sigma factor RsiW
MRINPMHLDEEQIQRFLHDELDTRAKEMLSKHVAGCESCARLLADAEREERAIFELLGHVDHPAPRVDAASLALQRRARAGWERWAAVIVVVAALGGAAYAIPGSPLRALVEHVAEWIADGDAQAPTFEEPSAPTTPVTSGIAVHVPGRFTIEFTSAQEGVVAVSLTDEPNLQVRVLGGTATFTTDVDRLTIDNRASAADYEIEIPRHAPFVQAAVGTRQIVLKDGAAFATGLPTDEHGRHVFSLSTEP